VTTKLPNPKVGSDRSPQEPSGNASPKDTYNSGMQPDHPTLRPKNNWKQRPRAGNDVPVPPELNLP
jgi:hypothetical protein